MVRFSEMVRLAELAGACEEELEVLSQFSSFEAARKHPNAPRWAVWYAWRVEGSRVPKLESVILSSPQCTYVYAKKVIKGLWPEGVAALKRDYFYWRKYEKEVGSWGDTASTCGTRKEREWRIG